MQPRYGATLNGWFHNTEYFSPYSTLIVTEKTTSISPSALTDPFDGLVWLLLGLFTLISLAILFYLHSKKKFRIQVLSILAIFIEQSQPLLQRFCTEHRKVLPLLLCLWLLLSSTLTNFYKADLSSAMTTVLPFKVPGSIEEMVQNDMFITTFTYYYKNSVLDSSELQTFPQLTDQLLPSLMIGEAGIDYPQYYDELHSKVFFAKQASSSYRFLKELHGGIVETDKGNRSFPSIFIVLSDKSKLDDIQWLIKSFSRKQILKGPDAMNFMFRSTWIGLRNYFFYFSEDALYRLKESGIMDLLQDKYDMGRRIFNLNGVGKDFQFDNGMDIKSINYVQFCLTSHYSDGQRQLVVPLPMKIFIVVLFAYFVCIGISLTAFVVENFHKRCLAGKFKKFEEHARIYT